MNTQRRKSKSSINLPRLLAFFVFCGLVLLVVIAVAVAVILTAKSTSGL